MIPAVNSNLNKPLETTIKSSFNYKMHLNEDVVVNSCDKKEAMEQVIYKILNTERYQYLIYSWNYGIELKDLFGMPVSYVCPEIERRVTEALTQDDRITAVYGFEFDTAIKHQVFTSFTVKTIFGTVDAALEVRY